MILLENSMIPTDKAYDARFLTRCETCSSTNDIKEFENKFLCPPCNKELQADLREKAFAIFYDSFDRGANQELAEIFLTLPSKWKYFDADIIFEPNSLDIAYVTAIRYIYKYFVISLFKDKILIFQHNPQSDDPQWSLTFISSQTNNLVNKLDLIILKMIINELSQ
jgi:hypothetical protein